MSGSLAMVGSPYVLSFFGAVLTRFETAAAVERSSCCSLGLTVTSYLSGARIFLYPQGSDANSLAKRDLGSRMGGLGYTLLPSTISFPSSGSHLPSGLGSAADAITSPA